jgi:hypothetical protein
MRFEAAPLIPTWVGVEPSDLAARFPKTHIFSKLRAVGRMGPVFSFFARYVFQIPSRMNNPIGLRDRADGYPFSEITGG